MIEKIKESKQEIVKIPQQGKIWVDWYDRPENYSRADKNRIAKQFSNKYGIDKAKIKVSYTAVKVDGNGNMIKIEGADIDNVMDREYQISLMKEWLERNNIKVDFDRIMALDNKVNSELDSDFGENSKSKWYINWVMLDNFLSFGENNFFPMGKYKGLTVVNSEPANQGGKCVRYDTKIKIQYNPDEIIQKLGFLPDELK